MSYVTCPDGKIYSRYDQSKYVKWCICNEKKQQQKRVNECMQNPTCKNRREMEENVIVYGSVFLIGLFAFLLYKLINKK